MPVFEKPDADVLVVGAGPTGLALAVGLYRLGVHCLTVDAEPPVGQARAMGLSARSLEVLRALGAVDRVMAEAVVWRTMDVHAGGRVVFRLPSDVSDMDSPTPYGAVLPQNRVTALLDDRLRELGGCVERPVKLTALQQDAAGVTATLTGPGGERRVRTRYLVGCDGAHSTVRHQLNLEFDGADYEDRLIAADVRVDWNLPQDSNHIFLGGDGTLTAFPFPEPGRWRLAVFGGNDPKDQGVEATMERLQKLMAEHGPPGAVVHDPTHTTSYSIHRRLVHRFRLGRCFVAGDAAHIHSPAGGQGMNTGMQDAFNLAWKLALVLHGKAGDALLDGYHAERHPVAEAVLTATDRMTRVVLPRGPVTAAVRDALLRFLGGVSSATHSVAHALSQLGVTYRGSPNVTEDLGEREGSQRAAFDRGPGPGDRAPDVVLARVGASSPDRLFDVLYQGNRHTLLAFAGLEPSSDDAADGDVTVALGPYADRVAAYRVPFPGSRPRESLDGGLTLHDPDGRLHRHYGAVGPCLYLIRPDGHVGYRSQPPDSSKLGSYLARVFG